MLVGRNGAGENDAAAGALWADGFVVGQGHLGPCGCGTGYGVRVSIPGVAPSFRPAKPDPAVAPAGAKG